MDKNNLWAVLRLLNEIEYLLLPTNAPTQSIELLIAKAREILKKELGA